MTGRDPRGAQPFFSSALLDAAVVGADEKLAHDTVILDVRDLQETFDALLVTSGRNDRQVRAIAEEIERQITLALDVQPLRVEGLAAAEWVALDYGDVIIHVFADSAREYYDLEHLWSGAIATRPSVLA